MARPSSYSEEYAEQAFKLCLLGFTDAELATFFEVCEATINNWKLEHPEFLESIKSGKVIADSGVANSLHSRAMGAEWEEQQAIKVKKVIYDNGKKISEVEEVVTVPVTRRDPPDTTACIFWLKNRRKAEWRDKQEHEVTGADGGPIQAAITVEFVKPTQS